MGAFGAGFVMIPSRLRCLPTQGRNSSCNPPCLGVLYPKVINTRRTQRAFPKNGTRVAVFILESGQTNFSETTTNVGWAEGSGEDPKRLRNTTKL